MAPLELGRGREVRAGKMPKADFQGSGWLVATIEAFEQCGSPPRRSH